MNSMLEKISVQRKHNCLIIFHFTQIYEIVYKNSKICTVESSLFVAFVGNP